MDEQEQKMTNQEEPMGKPGKGMAMDYKMMLLMMSGCLAASLLPLLISAGWLSGGIGGVSFIGIAVAVVLLFACCIPMMKMMVGGGKQHKDEP